MAVTEARRGISKRTPRRPHIHLVSAPWGFGPTAALAHVLAQLNPMRVIITLDTPAAAKVLVSDQLHSRDRASESANISFVATTGLNLAETTIVNFGRVDLLSEAARSRRHYFVDCVAWLTDRFLPTGVQDTFTYLVEYLPPLTRDEATRFGTPVRACISRKRHARRNGKPTILISSGGTITPGPSSANPLTAGLSRLLGDLQRDHRLAYATLTSGSPMRNSHTVSHASHLALIAEADVVVTVPGLYTVFEALEARCALLLLPPTNYTQYIQYHWYRAKGLVDPRLDWVELGITPPLGITVGTSKEELRFTSELRTSLDNKATVAAMTKLREVVVQSDFINPAKSAIGESVRREFMDCEFPGVQEVIDVI